MLKKLRYLDNTFSWSFFGFWIGIFGFAFGLWTYFHEPSPELTYEILANTSVIDIKDDIRDLEITYQGKDIHSGGRKLLIIQLRIVNSGKINIQKDFYDSQNSPLGISIGKSQIVQKPIILEASNEYLRESLNFNLSGPNKIELDPVILDAGDFFTVKLLALSESQSASLRPMGKIVGMKSIKLKNLYEEGQESGKSFSYQMYRLLLSLLTLASVIVIINRLRNSQRLNEKLVDALSRAITRFDELEDEIQYLEGEMQEYAKKTKEDR